MPSLNAWKIMTKPPAQRFVFERNPYFHRVDAQGRQLPYVDRWLIDLATASLFAPKANAGEVDLLARGLQMADAPVLKEGERPWLPHPAMAGGARLLLCALPQPHDRGSRLARAEPQP